MNYKRVIRYVLIPGLFFLVGTLIYYCKVFNPLMFPNPLLVGTEFFRIIILQETLSDMGLTFYRVLIGIAISLVIGIPAGLAIGYFKKLYDSLEFIIDFLRSIPVTALFPLTMLFFGIGDTAKIALAAWLTTTIILVNTSYGVRHLNKSYFNMAKVYNIPKPYFFKNIIFYGSLPHIFSGIRIAISLCIILIIVTEMFIGSVNGLGNAIINAHLAYEIPKMYSLIIITGIFGYALNKVASLIEKRVIHWTKQH